MATSYPFKPIVTDGLITYIDAINRKSYNGGTQSTDIVCLSIGSLNNGVDYSNGSFILDGIDDFIEFADVYNINGLSELTISFWVKPINNTGGFVSYWWTEDPNGGGIEIEIYNGIIYIAFYSSIYFYTNQVVSIDEWCHYNVIYNGNAGDVDRIKLIINNIEYSLSYSGVIPITIQDAKSLKIGVINDRYINALIPNTMIYNRVLTSDDILQNYNALKNKFI